MYPIRQKLLSQDRQTKKQILILHDIFIICIAYWLSLGFQSAIFSHLVEMKHWLIVTVLSISTVAIFYFLKLYNSVMRFSGSSMLRLLVYGSIVSTFILSMMHVMTESHIYVSLPFGYFFVLVTFLAASRITIREWLNNAEVKDGLPVVVYGAGQSGRQLVEAIKQVNEYRPIAFVDDNKELHGSQIHDLKVYSPDAIDSLKTKYGAQKILLAIPSLNKDAKRRIAQFLEQFGLEVLSIPGIKDLVDGKLSISNLKKISVLDLLGRTPIDPKTELMNANIKGKAVLVTGAGGSIGSELCRQIIKCQPKALVLFEISEFGLYSIHKEIQEVFKEKQLDIALYPILGSIQDKPKLLEVMKAFDINTIYHAAAYKHVPMVEYNMFSGIENNILGTYKCATAAIEANVERFVLISTDKAVRPTNTMGATKRFAELSLQALAKSKKHSTTFCMVRFGNVLGSSGSVVPVFEKQISEGGPITLTHKDIIRYFMTIPEAAQLVIQAGAMGTHGNVYVLDMGDPVKIYDLATQMIRLSGLTLKDENTPDGDIEITITGLRPGEKLYEELLIGDAVEETSHPRIMTANEISLSLYDFEQLLNQLVQAIDSRNYERARQILLDAPTAFNPKDGICDLIFSKNEDQKSGINKSCA